MSEIINLNKIRKQRLKKKEAMVAAQNRVLFGRTKEEKRRDTQAIEESRRKMDALKREPASDPES